MAPVLTVMGWRTKDRKFEHPYEALNKPWSRFYFDLQYSLLSFLMDRAIMSGPQITETIFCCWCDGHSQFITCSMCFKASWWLAVANWFRNLKKFSLVGYWPYRWYPNILAILTTHDRNRGPGPDTCFLCKQKPLGFQEHNNWTFHNAQIAVAALDSFRNLKSARCLIRSLGMFWGIAPQICLIRYEFVPLGGGDTFGIHSACIRSDCIASSMVFTVHA